MNTKFLVAGVLGFVALFLLGWVVYGMLLGDTLAATMNPACTKTEAEMNLGLIALGNLFWSFALAFVLSNWSGGVTMASGAKAGAILGLLMAGAYDFMIYGSSNMMTSINGVIYDMVITTVMFGIAGAVIGWWLSRK